MPEPPKNQKEMTRVAFFSFVFDNLPPPSSHMLMLSAQVQIIPVPIFNEVTHTDGGKIRRRDI